MKKLIRSIFSISAAGFSLLLIAFVLGFATIVEHNHGFHAARVLVYQAHWFEMILFVMTVALVYNIYRFRLYKKEKLTIGLFHMAFILIVLGAGVTRYFGQEGIMHIREGESSNEMVGGDQWFQLQAEYNGQTATMEQPSLLSIYSKRVIDGTIRVGSKTIRVQSVDYLPRVFPVLQPAEGGEPMIELVFAGSEPMRSKILRRGELFWNGEISFGFEKEADICFSLHNDSLSFISRDTLQSMSMGNELAGMLPPGIGHNATLQTVYRIREKAFVIRDFSPSAAMIAMAADPMTEGSDAVLIRLSDGDHQKTVTYWIGDQGVEESQNTNFEGVNLQMRMGPKKEVLPFSLKLNDFVLERYPGSNSPSSYESNVVLVDNELGVSSEEHIFMNNVLKYRGYRFYQSSYDSDEKGTILSVNHDRTGTLITYLGYLLLFFGILFSVFNRESHFSRLMRKAAVPVAVILLILGVSQKTSAAVKEIPRSSAKAFSEVWVQGLDGRIKPFSTLAYEVVMKMSRTEKIDGMIPEQVVLGMAAYPENWRTIPLIAVSDNKLRELLGITRSKAAYADFFDQRGGYKLARAVNEAYAKSPAKRGSFDNMVIKTDERLNVAYMIFTNDLFRLFPSKETGNHEWSSPGAKQNGSFGSDSLLVARGFSEYLQAMKSGNIEKGESLRASIMAYQASYGSALIPGKTKQQLEIIYYRINIIKGLMFVYLLCGFGALFLLFNALLTGKVISRKGVWVVLSIIVAGFILHTAGLAIRGYISGHMPWSNGYESMIYVSWAGMLAGLVFARRNPMVLGAAAILSGLTLFVAQMSWLNPEITNLVPVLKSYWLSFHVAIITASYGFVGVCAIIGLLNLVMNALRTAENGGRVDRNIQHMTIISEAAMILGLYFLTVGTFLGAIWANESWGRYWGWDPKETWSLVSILIYAFIAHMRLIPGFRGWFAFNVASVIGLLSVLMTYLGVNYYLSGLHSYGSGSGVSFPGLMIALFLVIGIIVYLARRKISQRE